MRCEQINRAETTTTGQEIRRASAANGAIPRGYIAGPFCQNDTRQVIDLAQSVLFVFFIGALLTIK